MNAHCVLILFEVGEVGGGEKRQGERASEVGSLMRIIEGKVGLKKGEPCQSHSMAWVAQELLRQQ